MSIQSEINRISGNVSDALDAIEDKGVTIPSGANSDDLADLIAQITGGGGVGGITQDEDGYLVLSPDAPSPTPSGGLEYEEGTFSPTEDIAGTNVTINFANTHSTSPIFVMITDATGTYDATTYSEYTWVMANMYGFTGQPIYHSTDGAYYMQGYHRARASTASGLSAATVQSSSITNDYLSNTSFKPYYSQSYYYRAGRTYKWIAVWAPTT